MMPSARTIFSRLFHTRYILVVRISSWNEGKESSGHLLESKFSLIRDESHVCTKETSITGWLFAGPRVVTPQTTRTANVMEFRFNGQRSVVQLPRFNGDFLDVTDRRTVKQFRGDHGQAPRVHKFCTCLVATSKFYAPQWWHIASSTITLSNILHWTTNFKQFFLSVMNMLLIYLLASLKLENGHKNYLALVLKLYFTMLFYEIGWNIIRKGVLNKYLNTIHWKRMCLVYLFCLEIIFTT